MIINKPKKHVHINIKYSNTGNFIILLKLYNKLYTLIVNYSYTIFIKYIDKGLLEVIGPFGFYKFFKKRYKNIISQIRRKNCFLVGDEIPNLGDEK